MARIDTHIRPSSETFARNFSAYAVLREKLAQARDADEVAAQQRDEAAREINELQRSLQQEQEKSAVLAKQASAGERSEE